LSFLPVLSLSQYSKCGAHEESEKGPVVEEHAGVDVLANSVNNAMKFVSANTGLPCNSARNVFHTTVVLLLL